jgi:hypothetical protein
MAKAAQRCEFEVNVAKSQFIQYAPDLPFERQLYSPNDCLRSTTITASFLNPYFPDGSVVSAWRLRLLLGKPSDSNDFLLKRTRY